MLHDPNHELLFPKLTDEELQRLAEQGRKLQLSEGDILFKEGDPAYHFYIVLEGEVKVTKQVGGDEQLLTIHQPGEFTGEISMLMGHPSLATARAVGNCQVLEIQPETFRRIITECSQAASVILTAMTGRTQEVESHLKQQEKLAALGKLSAGLAHELNNPAAAGHRAASQLRESLQSVQSRTLGLCDLHLSTEQRQLLDQLQQSAVAHCTTATPLDPLTQSDQEETLIDWLDQLGVENGWQLAPTLVSAGVSEAQLQPLADQLSGEAMGEVLSWLEASLSVGELVNAVEQSTARISQLVKAIKEYSYMDQAPLQEVDVHCGLENTLTILNHKLKYGITVIRQYGSDLPRVCAYGSELNQVWTNLIDNAVYAMKGQGEITIRTTHQYDYVSVEIADNGPGIPLDIQTRIFEPFFTTKGVGEGSGLGLDIARRIVVQRHHGSIRFDSKPGSTCFRICLPIKPPSKNHKQEQN